MSDTPDDGRREIRAMGASPERPTVVLGYMCGIDFECELGLACGGNRVYPSVDDLKEHRGCWPQCGILEVEVRATRWVVAQNSDPGADQR